MPSLPPPLPDKLSMRIGEAAECVGVKPHVLRYWEQELGRPRPQKSRSGQRVYARGDVELLRRIRILLHERGFTVSAVKSLLRQGDAAIEGALALGGNKADGEAELREEISMLKSQLSAAEREIERLSAELIALRRQMQKEVQVSP